MNKTSKKMEQKTTLKSVADYAKEKNISVQAVYQAIKRGNLNSKKIGSFTFVVV